MSRLLFWLAIASFAWMAIRRLLLRAGQSTGGKRPPIRIDVRESSASSVICATCSTQYVPQQTGWQCPQCKR